jgi:hypothetical protein
MCEQRRTMPKARDEDEALFERLLRRALSVMLSGPAERAASSRSTTA